MKNPENRKLKTFWKGQSIRLSDADRAFFSDLSKVRIIATTEADQFHFSKNKSGSQDRLERFVELGLLKRHSVFQPGKGSYRAYSFQDSDFARAWGGKTATIGAKRTTLHEVVVSKLYFAMDRPDSFQLEAQLSDTQRDCFRPLGASKPMAPDAVFTNSQGQMVAIEADSGQYTQSQVQKKMRAWAGIAQVWGQPLKASARIRENAGISVFRF